MSTTGWASEDQYMAELFAFLAKYQWIYNNKNTDILTRDVLANFSQEWRDYFSRLSTDELHDLATGSLKEPAPPDLKSFINELNYLKPHEIESVTRHDEFAKNVGISPKKSHEIAHLAPVIDEICQKTGCDLVLDLGSGIGHLPHLLHSEYGYPVLALEASHKLVDSARSNQAKFHPESRGKVVFEELFVSSSSASHLKNLLEQHFPTKKTLCLTGLHACADLSVEVQRLFVDLSMAQALVIMPCCYHRMGLVKEEAGEQWFKSLPVSQLENCTVRRLKRKSGKSDAPDIDGGFQDYLNNLSGTHELVPPNPDMPVRISDSRFLSKMHEKWTAHKTDCRQVEVLMGLQGAIQALCENVILLDRVAFLKEKGFHCYNRKITNDALSPRCWALISEKNREK